MQINNIALQQQLQNDQDQDYLVNLKIKATQIQDHYLLDCQAIINSKYKNIFITQTFLLFILQLRSGMNIRSLEVLKQSILQLCEQALEKQLNNFGFIINGEYFTIKKANYEAIKQILSINLIIRQQNKQQKQDLYLQTLIKLRHVLQTQIYKYCKKIDNINLIFFTSSIQINNQFGVKKQSYIQQLNSHSSQCYKQILKIQKVLIKNMKYYNSHVIGIQKYNNMDQDNSLADKDLYDQIYTLLGQNNSLYYMFDDIEEKRQNQGGNYMVNSLNKLNQAFKAISSMMTMDVQVDFMLPLKNKQNNNKNEQLLKDKQQEQLDQIRINDYKHLNNKSQKYKKYSLRSSNIADNRLKQKIFILKKQLDLQKLLNKQIRIQSSSISSIIQQKHQKLQQQQQPYQQIPENYLFTLEFIQLSTSQLISNRIFLYNTKLSYICQQLKKQIIKFRRIYDGNGKSHIKMLINQDKQYQLKSILYYIEQQSKQIYQIIFKSDQFNVNVKNNINKQSSFQIRKLKRQSYEQYSSLKRKIDISHEVLMRLHKRQIKNDQIRTISSAINYWNIKNSLKNKLIRRINLNPQMIDQTYQKIHNIVQKSNNYPSLQTLHKQAKHAIGNCIKSNMNFATALRKQDCMAILLQIQRPQSAIVEPGRIKIRQISPFAISVENFFNIYHYGIDQIGQLDLQKGGEWFRQYGKIQKSNYKQMWDYWNRIQSKSTVPALIPVYLCDQHWQVAKLLMKPCLGWTASGEPLGYTFAQTQTIPFMALSFAIRRVQELKYQIIDLQTKFQKNQFKVMEYSQLQRDILQKKILLKRMINLKWVLEQTCYQIVRDLSQNHLQQKLSESIKIKYENYIKQPLSRTIDIINNNSSFLGQLYCIIKLKLLQLPQQLQFHQFFKHLIQQQLRRQTDSWSQSQQTQDKFLNKLLNSQTQKMQAPQYIILQSQYYDKFISLQNGQIVHKTYFQIKRNQLQMMLKKNGQFNDTQKMLLIEYKRLYENRVLWMWYVRFQLYKEIERVKIYKWKSLDLINSYMLFTLIIQNKTQRKNYKRRQAIIKDQYVNPFNYQKAQQFLEMQFLRLRAQKQKHHILQLNMQKFGTAATTFTQTKSLQQAAGTLINFDIGQIQCRTLYEQLMKGKGIIMEEKLRMLLVGQFKNVKLFSGWKMNRQKNRLLRQKYPEIYMKYGYML